MRPCRVDIPRAVIDDLRRLITSAPAHLRDLAEHWRTGFDWRAAERRINAYPQYVTPIDGVEMHFLHARSAEPAAVPLLLTHGRPGACAEFLGVIEALTDPVRHGGQPHDAFHVVVPSLPGGGLSAASGENTAAACATLMARLGHHRYVVHGGDLGAALALRIGERDSDHVAAVHLSAPAAAPVVDPSVAANSPVGHLARIAAAAVDRDDLLTVASLSWFTRGTGPDAEPDHPAREVLRRAVPWSLTMPVGVLCAADRADRAAAERVLPTLSYWHEHDGDATLPALTRPQLLVEDLRRFAGAVRTPAGVDPAALGPAEFASLVRRASTEELLGLMRGERRRAVLERIFLDMPAVFRPDLAGPDRKVVHWHVGDRTDGREDVFELVLADGVCQVSTSPRQAPRLVLTIGAVDFLRVVTGVANPTTLFLRGRMKAKGDLGLAMRFPKLFEVPRP